MTLRRYVLAALSLVVVIVVAWGGGGDVDTVTAEQAGARVEEHIRSLVAVLPGAQLEVFRPVEVNPCLQALSNDPSGQVSARAIWWVRDVPPERNAEIFDIAVRYWEERGWTVRHDFRPQHASVYAEAPDPDLTNVNLQESVDGSQVLSISASSPCVWPNGTPPQ